MNLHAEARPRWRRAVKVAIVVTLAILAAPIALVILLGRLSEARR